MWRRTSTGLAGWMGLMLLTASGCTVSIQPWHRQPGGPVPIGDPNAPGFVPVGFQGPMPKTLPTSMHGVSNDTLAQWMAKYNDADDQRKALTDQVATLKRQLKDREDSLRLASHEMEESSAKLKRTRDDFRQWESEMNEMRERIRKLEDNRKAVGSLIEEILQHLERPREPVRLPILDRSTKRE